MKSKLFLMFIASCAISAKAYTQFHVGVKAGIDIANQNPAVAGFSATGDILKIKTNSIARFEGGVFGDIQLNKKLQLRPEILYATEGFLRNMVVDFVGNTIIDKVTYNIRYLNVPLQLLYTPSFHSGSIWLGAGPYGAVAISGKAETEAGSSKLKFGNKTGSTFKRFDGGLSATAGVKLKNGLLLGGSYRLGLMDVTPGSGSAKNLNRVLSIFLGFSF